MFEVIRAPLPSRRAAWLTALGLGAALMLGSCGAPQQPQDHAPQGALGRALAAEGRTGATARPARPDASPYIVIRFDRPGITFDDTLYSALSRALERYPSAQFDVILAMPPLAPHGDPEEALRLGEQHIEDVVLTMTDMGLPSERLRIAASTDSAVAVDEIRIFVR